jgi:predicted nuclease of predicted toxin-antitoxin system
VHILADANVPRAIVTWLVDQDHDVLYAAEARVQTADIDLLTEAEADGYIILTEDKDFGELVYRDRRNSHGIVLLRMPDVPVTGRLARLQDAWEIIESNLPGNFIVVTPNRLRVRPLGPP